jgi:hypothetical protein
MQWQSKGGLQGQCPLMIDKIKISTYWDLKLIIQDTLYHLAFTQCFSSNTIWFFNFNYRHYWIIQIDIAGLAP